MAPYFNLSFLLLPLIQSILLYIRDSTGERKVFEKCFYDLKGEIYCYKCRNILPQMASICPVLHGGQVGEGKLMHALAMGQRQKTHTGIWSPKKAGLLGRQSKWRDRCNVALTERQCYLVRMTNKNDEKTWNSWIQLKGQHWTLPHSPPNFPQQQKVDHRLPSCNLIPIPYQKTKTWVEKAKKHHLLPRAYFLTGSS